MATVLRLSGVTKGYLEGERVHPVLQGVDFSVEAGEFVALVGPSGSGKSTLLNLISGLDSPDTGEIEVAGVHLPRLSETERTLFRGRRIGFVFQSYNLVPTLTVQENVLLPIELRRSLTTPDRNRARELLESIGLGDRGESWPDRLSGGERQRIAIARALIHDPELVLADEPTGNLDARTGSQILGLMESLFRTLGTTLVTVTHAPAVAERMERVLELRDGRVVEANP